MPDFMYLTMLDFFFLFGLFNLVRKIFLYAMSFLNNFLICIVKPEKISF